jgi:hypothetical protein
MGSGPPMEPPVRRRRVTMIMVVASFAIAVWAGDMRGSMPLMRFAGGLSPSSTAPTQPPAPAVPAASNDPHEESMAYKQD